MTSSPLITRRVASILASSVGGRRAPSSTEMPSVIPGATAAPAASAINGSWLSNTRRSSVNSPFTPAAFVRLANSTMVFGCTSAAARGTWMLSLGIGGSRADFLGSYRQRGHPHARGGGDGIGYGGGDRDDAKLADGLGGVGAGAGRPLDKHVHQLRQVFGDGQLVIPQVQGADAAILGREILHEGDTQPLDGGALDLP